MARKETVKRDWHQMDADGVVLGRLASTIASVLMGKHRADYTPHVDTGDFIVVINASKIRLTGKKLETKVYRHHTGHLGKLKEKPISEVMARRPETVIELAVKRMMPKTKLGRAMFKKLKVYAGPDHPHEAQRPSAWARGYGRGSHPTGGKA